LKFKTRLTKFNLDMDKYRGHVAEKMRNELRKAVRVWLNATVRTVVPTWSGASRATFEVLAKKAGASISYGPQKSYKDRKPLGRKESFATLSVDRKAGQYFFEWGTTLRYFILNNYTTQTYTPGAKDTGSGVILYKKGLDNPGPYNLDQKGEKALKDFVASVSLPSPFNFIGKRKL